MRVQLVRSVRASEIASLNLDLFYGSLNSVRMLIVSRQWPVTVPI
jgi:hypothetical protein